MLGVQKWLGEYNAERPERAELANEVSEFMRAFDTKEKDQLDALKKGNKVDADGFITVIPKIKKRLGLETPSNVKPLKTYGDFYKFQKMDEKRAKLEELRKRFDEDKKKIAQMRAQRKFRPF